MHNPTKAEKTEPISTGKDVNNAKRLNSNFSLYVPGIMQTAINVAISAMILPDQLRIYRNTLP